MSCLVNRLFQWGGRHCTRPNLEFPAFNNTPGSIVLHFQNDSPRRCRDDKFLPSRDSGGPPQLARKHNPVRGVEFDRHFHGISMAWSWRICKLNGRGCRSNLLGGMSRHAHRVIAWANECGQANGKRWTQIRVPLFGFRKVARLPRVSHIIGQHLQPDHQAAIACGGLSFRILITRDDID